MKVGGNVISASVQTENLQAGYEYQDVEDSGIYYAAYRDDNFCFTPLPVNWTKKVLLSFTPRDPNAIYGPSWDSWKYQVYFTKKVLVLRPL
jgi:hypothetical protein